MSHTKTTDRQEAVHMIKAILFIAAILVGCSAITRLTREYRQYLHELEVSDNVMKSVIKAERDD